MSDEIVKLGGDEYVQHGDVVTVEDEESRAFREDLGLAGLGVGDMPYPIYRRICEREYYWRIRCSQALKQLEEAKATIKALGDNLNDANKERGKLMDLNKAPTGCRSSDGSEERW